MKLNNKVKIIYDPSDKKFKLLRTIGGVAQTPVESKETYWLGSACLKFVLRMSATKADLTIQNGQAPEILTDDGMTALLDDTIIRRFGNFPMVVLNDWHLAGLPLWMTDTDVATVMNLGLPEYSIPTPGGSTPSIYGGIEFPNGALSFADEVIRYDPLYSGGPAPTAPTFTDPQSALGPPDFSLEEDASSEGAVSLGQGGLLELHFVDNYLINSGDSVHDLYIFEVESDVEDTYVAIRPTPETALILGGSHDANGDGYYEIGKVCRTTPSIDFDSIFPGHDSNTLFFDAVQLIDDRYIVDSNEPMAGANIDAVGAIGSVRSCNYSMVGDLNRDCQVNLKDFVIMARNWLLDSNNDVVMIVRNWLLDCKQTPKDPACVPLP